MPTPTETWYANADWRSFQRTEYPYQYAEDVVIRYIDLTDPRDLEAKVTYLSALTGITALKVNGETVVGTWNTHFARYEPINPNDDRGYILRLYHALIPAGLTTGDGDGVYVTENNCTFKVSLTFYWRQAALMNPVTAGTSGVTYRIVGINRDRLTGLYDYILEKREQITTYVAEYVVSDTQFDTTYEQKFIGVRKTAEGTNAYTKDNAGNVIASLYTMTNVQGTTYTQDISKNDNCTADITQRKVVAKYDVTANESKTKDVYHSVASIEVRNHADGDAEYVAPAAGLVTTKDYALNPDGTFNNRKSEDQEIALLDAVKVESEDAAKTVTEQEHANQLAVAAIPGVPTEGTLVEVTNTKTKGGWYNQRIRTIVARLWSAAVKSVTLDLYEKVTDREDQAVALADLPDETTTPTGGVWYTRIFTKRLDRKYDVRETKHEEQKVDEASLRTTKTLYTEVSETNSIDATKLGPASAPTGGVVSEFFNKLTRGGKYERTERTVKELAVTNAEVVKAKGQFEDRTVVTNRSQVAAASDPAAFGVAVTNKQTDAGRFDQSTETRTPNAVTDSTKMQTGDFAESTVRTDQSNQAAADSTTPGLTNSGQNNRTPGSVAIAKVTTIVNRKTDLGKFDTSKSEDVPEASWSQAFTFTSSDGDTVKMYLFNNMTQAALQAAFDAIGEINGISPTMRVNKYGLYDGSITFKYNADADVEWTAWSHDITRRRRLANGQSLEYTGTAAFGFNVSDGSSTFYGGTQLEGSWFRSVGRNWYMYEKLTAVSVVT